MAWADPAYDSKIDMWSVGLILAEMCGEVFHKVPPRSDDAATLAAYKTAVMQQLGTAKTPSTWKTWKPVKARDRQPWPPSVRQQIGSIGEQFLNALLEWDPRRRPSARFAQTHSYQQPERLALGGYADSDEDGKRGFVPRARVLHTGSRHNWNILTGTIGIETLTWLRQDLADPSFLDIDFEASRPDVKTEENRKFIMSGKMCAEPASGAMCGLSLARLLPLPRLRAWFAAFKAANADALSELNRLARTAATACEAEGQDRNRAHFLASPFDSWFVSAGELVIAKASGDWQEPWHQDGGASVMHLGLTLYGERTMTCRTLCAEPDIVVRNVPGTVYWGGLTGPTHGVQHTPSPPDQLLEETQSVSVMMRTTLFPHTQSRLRGTTPHPVEFFHAISASFAASLADSQWRLPTLAACVREYDASLRGGASGASLRGEASGASFRGRASSASSSSAAAGGTRADKPKSDKKKAREVQPIKLAAFAKKAKTQ